MSRRRATTRWRRRLARPRARSPRRPHQASRPEHPSQACERDEPGGERSGGRSALLAGSGIEDDVRRASEAVVRPVRDGDQRGTAAATSQQLREVDDLGALARLAHGDHRRRGIEDPGPEVHELRGAEHERRATPARELSDERIARGVGATHPGDDHRVGPREPGDAPECLPLVPEAVAARRSASGCPRSRRRGQEKFPNDFTAAVYDAVPWV